MANDTTEKGRDLTSTPLNQISVGICSTGNTQALLLCLASILNAESVPALIRIRMEGKISDLGGFYMEQLIDLARLRGCSVEIISGLSRGVRCARDFIIQTCPTKWLWMLDDDTIVHPRCMDAYLEAVENIPKSELVVYFAGSKFDVNNRRQYANFGTDELTPSTIDCGPDVSQNLIYNVDEFFGYVFRTYLLDTGNCLMNTELIKKEQLAFAMFPESVNSGGEDTIFALVCDSRNLPARFVPAARVAHLEKPNMNFGEFAARKEMVLRAGEIIKLSKDKANRALFAWLKPQENSLESFQTHLDFHNRPKQQP